MRIPADNLKPKKEQEKTREQVKAAPARTLADEMRLKREQEKAAIQKKTHIEVDVKQSMRLSIWEGGFFGGMTGLTQQFLSPFAILFGAGSFIISLLATLPNLIGSVFQLSAPRLLALVRRPRRYIVIFIALQGCTWIALSFVRFAPRPIELLLVVTLAVLNATFALMINPVWMSYKGDLVPENQRSWFFGKRSTANSIAVFAGTLLAGIVLSRFTSNPYLGFAILFALAGALRLVCTIFLLRSHDSPASLPESGFTFREFLRRAPKSELGHFAFFTVLLRFAAYVAVPLFAVYELKVLKLSYAQFTALQVASLVGTALSMWFWAHYAERRGNRRIISVTTFFIGFVPFLYILVAREPVGTMLWWLFAFEIMGGFAWGGFNLATSNYLLEATTAKSRTHAVAYFNLFNNLFIFLGGMLGSLIVWFGGIVFPATVVDEVSRLSPVPFLIAFGVSGVLRFVMWARYRRAIHELRFVEVRLDKGVPSLLTIHPQGGPVYEHFITTPGEVRATVERRFEPPDIELPEREGIVERMSLRERETYNRKFVERYSKK